MKIISIILIVLNIISSAAFCTGGNIDSVTASIKKKLEIPEYYLDFRSVAEQNANETVYNLSWSGENDQEGGYIGVSVDEAGRVIYYNRYEYGNFEGNYKFSTLDYNGAAKIAYDNIKKICPEFAYNVRPEEKENYLARNSDFYQIYFYRYENGVPYYDNYIVASISANDKKLSELVVRWYDISHFPKAQGIISPERAKKAFWDSEIISAGFYEINGCKAVPLYGFDKSEYKYINAFTGETTKTNLTWGRYYLNKKEFDEKPDAKITMQLESSESAGVFAPVDNILRSFKIGNGYVLKNKTLYSDLDRNYYYKLELVCGENENLTLELNAKTNELTRFIRQEAYGKEDVIDEQAAYNKALDFFKAASPDRVDKCADGSVNKVLSKRGGYNYRIAFPRLVNDIPYYDNGVIIIVSANDGRVISYQMDWDEGQTFALSQVTKPQAQEYLFDAAQYDLRYITIAKSRIKTPSNVNDIDVRLVYDFLPGAPSYINAETGTLYYDDFTPFLKIDGVYHDIEGHPSYNSIKTLLFAGLLESGKMYYPDENISQEEYLNRLYYAIKNESLDNYALYSEMKALGVLSEEEINADTPITFENAIKYTVKLLGFTDVANLSDTFKTNFMDESMIRPDLIGYAAIAQGLGIVKGNVFLPKRYVTKALTAEIIYNILMPRRED